MNETKTDETKPSDTKPKKMVGRTVAIALGIVCILLIAGLGGAMAYYVSTHSHDNSEHDALQSQENDLYNLSILNKTATLVNNQNISLPPNGEFEWKELQVWYAGYIVVGIWESTGSHPYIQVSWTAYNLPVSPTRSQNADYENQTNFGNWTDNWIYAVFPVLPTFGSPWYLDVRVGNNNTVGTAIENVTITYYY